jgi:hypothetical protein
MSRVGIENGVIGVRLARTFAASLHGTFYHELLAERLSEMKLLKLAIGGKSVEKFIRNGGSAPPASRVGGN